MQEKNIKDNQYPRYSFRMDPVIFEEMKKIKEDESWNKLFKKLLDKYGQQTITGKMAKHHERKIGKHKDTKKH